ncbi:helix-turn-helix transcriptional regulator [Gordonia sp. DT219]|uniref:helix-turn-helix transcriptional regulator n=1 Tax=Gordonia sp. DT219 TaxID=3416658 RepID=UPI003CE99A7B
MEVRDPAKLRRERKQMRYTQRELGMLVRRTQTTIYKLENGQLKNIKEDLALAIAARLNCHWEDLFIAHEESSTPNQSVVSTDKIPA